MPKYVYKCKNCGTVVESKYNKSIDKRDDCPPCPSCLFETKRIFSPPIVTGDRNMTAKLHRGSKNPELDAIAAENRRRTKNFPLE